MGALGAAVPTIRVHEQVDFLVASYPWLFFGFGRGFVDATIVLRINSLTTVWFLVVFVGLS